MYRFAVDIEEVLSGAVRPPNIPANWQGEPLPDGAGWRWFDPSERTSSVRIYRGDPNAADPTCRNTYVVVTQAGRVIGRDGQPTGEILID